MIRILAVGKVKSPEYTALATRYLARIRNPNPVLEADDDAETP